MKGEGSSEGGELTQQGARKGVEVKGDGKSNMWGSRSCCGMTHSQGALKILGNAFSTLAARFSIVEGYLRVTWDKLHTTNPQIQMGFFEALQKLWH